MANHTEAITTQNLVTKKVGNGYYTLVDPVNVKWVSAQHHSRMFTYPGCGICRRSLTANKAGKYVCPSHTVQKNPVPCFLARMLLQDTQSETNFWCTSFHDVTTKWMGISAREYEALSDDAKVCASENFRGAVIQAKIRKSVQYPFDNYVLVDAQVLFTQKEMEAAVNAGDTCDQAAQREGGVSGQTE